MRVGANDRVGLEHLCRYLARPPIANDRLQELTDGRLAMRFKQAWRDGTTHIVYTPHELIEKLIPLISRPRCHLVRYHGLCRAPHKPCYAERSIMRSAATCPSRSLLVGG